MMCEECGKRPARMAVTMITSGKATTRRLCPQCAARLQRGDAQSVQTALLSALAGDNPPRPYLSLLRAHNGAISAYRAFGLSRLL